MRDSPDALLVLVQRIADDVCRLREDVRALAARAPVADDARVADLLAAIHGSIGDRVFSGHDLIVFAQLPEGAAVRAAIMLAISACNARRIGKCFARIEGRDLGGLVVVRVDSDGSGVLWTVRRVSES